MRRSLCLGLLLLAGIVAGCATGNCCPESAREAGLPVRVRLHDDAAR